jgi:hypothetical protein
MILQTLHKTLIGALMQLGEIDGQTDINPLIPIVNKWHIFISDSHSVTDVVRHSAERRKNQCSHSRGALTSIKVSVLKQRQHFLYIMHTEKGSLLSAAGLSRTTLKSGA